MLSLFRFVARTVTAFAMLQLFTSLDSRAQENPKNSIGNEVSVNELADEQSGKKAEAERYEKIVRSRPQLGPAFEKLYSFHLREGTIADFCKRLEMSANERNDGNAFQLLGLLQLRSGQAAEAATNLTRAETLLPNDPFASLYRARALALNRQYPDALVALNNAANRKPTQLVAIEILKDLRQLKDRGTDTEVAVELLALLEKQFAANPQVNEKLADCLIELGRPEAAIPIYENLIELTRDPLRRVELRIQLARLKKRLGDPEQALLEFEQLLSKLKPESWLHTALLEQIEQLAEELRGIDGVIQYYENNLQQRPEDITSRLRLAEILRRHSRFDEAKAAIAKAMELSPSQPEPLLAMVALMEDTKQFASASALMQKLVELDPKNADYIVRWGRLVLQDALTESATENSASGDNSRRVDAVAIWQRLLIGHENDPVKAIQVAELFRSAAFQDEAIAMYKHAVDLSGGKVDFSEQLAGYLVEINHADQAKEVLTSAIDDAANDHEALVRLSEISKRLRFPVEALRAIEKACEIRAEFGDLIQLANLQIDSEQFEAAVEPLNRASKLAESSADLTLLWTAQTRNYQRLDNLPERVHAQEKMALGSNAGALEPLQQLALMQAANQQFAEAAATALQATLLQPESTKAWLLAAQLQKEAGLSLREIDSLLALSKLDERHSADYLQRIAAIQFQLNQVDLAFATMEKIFASSSATLQHFQMAAAFYLSGKKPDQAIGLLRRATQLFPNDRSAWMLLARQSMELKDNKTAREAIWHMLELARDQTQQREAVDLLVALYEHKADNSALIEDLKQFGIAHEQESDADLWAAWALLESDDTKGSSELIANLLKRGNVQPEALRAAVGLASRNHDYSQAADIQRRLVQEEPTAINQLRLGETLWQAGEFASAEAEWKNLMRLKANESLVTDFARQLAEHSNWALITALANIGTEMELTDWEFLSIAIFAHVQNKNLAAAAELSDRLLALDLPPATIATTSTAKEAEVNAVPLTAKDRLAWMEHAGTWQASLNVVDVTRAGYRTNQTNPRASQAAAVRHLALQRGASLRSSTATRFHVQCFAEARALAVLVKFGNSNRLRTGSSHEFARYVTEAIESKDVDKLWDCVLVMEPASGSEVAITSTGVIEHRDKRDTSVIRYQEVLDELVDLNEPAAGELAINEIVMRRQLQHQMADRLSQPVPPIDSRDLARLQNLVHSIDHSAPSTVFAGEIVLAVELM